MECESAPIRRVCQSNTLTRCSELLISVQVSVTLQRSLKRLPSPCSTSEAKNIHCSRVFSAAAGTKSFSFSCCVLGFDLSNLLPASLTARLDPHSPRHSTCPEQTLRNTSASVYQASRGHRRHRASASGSSGV